MKISIAMCTYNGMTYLEDQLDSIRLQTRTPDEVLISDDNSTDGTVSFIKKYIDEYKLTNWIIRINKPNLGWRKNFVETIKDTTGDIVFTCDQDDVWNVNKIEMMAKIMETHDEINLLTSNFFELYEDGSVKEVKPYIINGDLLKVNLPINILNCPFPGCVHCIKKTFYNNNISYWLESCPHDAFFWRTAILDDSAYVYNKSLIQWRKHSDSAFQKELSGITKNSELFWRKQERKELLKLIEYVNNESNNNTYDKINLLQNNLNWVNDREKACLNPNYKSLLKLMLEYRKLYPNTKSILKDWYIFLTK